MPPVRFDMLSADPVGVVSAGRRGGGTVFQWAQFELARLEHHHGGDEWHEMHDVTPAHDSAEADPERQWSTGRIFRCAVCADEIRVSRPDASPTEGGSAAT